MHIILYEFWFFPLILWLEEKYYIFNKLPKNQMWLNRPIQKKPSKSLCPPQELEEGPRSGPYFLVLIKGKPTCRNFQITPTVGAIL